MGRVQGANEISYRVTVVVAGDLGRSPRMLNHALALARCGAEVSLAGYADSPIDRAVLDHPRIRCYPLSWSRRTPAGAGRMRFLAESAARFAILQVQLLWLLVVRTPRPDALLVQNPPSVPTLAAAWIAARLRGAAWLVDWHNFGYSMLALRLGERHIAVGAARRWEQILGRRADGHFCVSRAMRDALQTFGISGATILYDAPGERQEIIPVADRSRRAAELLGSCGIGLPDGAALLIAPTSWSADEEMDVLLDALTRFDASARPELRLLALATGRGPLRERFEQRAKRLSLRRVSIRTAFLDPAIYRELLRAAHLGVSLHRSASGVDLPIKLADFAGAGTPVCALDYGPVLRERVAPGAAVLFRDGSELACAIAGLLEGFPDRPARLESMQRRILETCEETWFEQWNRVAADRFRGLMGADRTRKS